jgi:hypothetical protein
VVAFPIYPAEHEAGQEFSDCIKNVVELQEVQLVESIEQVTHGLTHGAHAFGVLL